MPQRRFTEEELEELAAQEELDQAEKRSVLRALASWLYSGVLLIACVFKRRSTPGDLTRDLKSQYPKPTWDRLLRTDAAAETFGVSRQYFYDHERELPFVVRLPSGALRVSEQGMLSWIEKHRGE